MYHIVYLTTNLINNKIYIGIHSTYNLNDGYIGSGKYLKLAIRKYGKNNFKYQILHFAYDINHLRELERMIVDDTFICRRDTYNTKLGGNCHSIEERLKLRLDHLGKEFSNTHKENISKSAKERVKRDGMPCNNKEKYQKLSENMKGKKPHNYGIPCSEARKQKLRDYHQRKREEKLNSIP